MKAPLFLLCFISNGLFICGRRKLDLTGGNKCLTSMTRLSAMSKILSWSLSLSHSLRPQKGSDELARASGKQPEAVSNADNKTALGSKGTNSVAISSVMQIVHILFTATNLTLLS